MRREAALLGAAAIVAFSVPANAARLTGWYGVFEGGGTYIHDVEVATYIPLGATTTSTVAAEYGWAGIAGIGYAYDNGWRVEVEGGYRNNAFETRTIGAVATPMTGDLSQITAMVNFMYDFPSSGPVTFSVGAGVGADWGRIDTPSLGSPILSDDVSLAFQAIAGLSFRMASWLDLVLNYRFLYVTGFEFEEPQVAPVFHADFDSMSQHLVTVGLRFGSHQDPTPQVIASAPPPAPPPPARQYVIYFGFNKCNVTADADTVLSDAAASAKQLGSVAIKIVGHTDTVGSQRANQRLSECRANAAKTNLVGKGIPAGSISAAGAGETQLVVQTGDGMKEPQNRRATIDLN